MGDGTRLASLISAWEKQGQEDAKNIYKFLVEQYRAGRRDPLSVTRLAEGTGLKNRERLNKALTILVVVDKTVGVVGDNPERSTFYPKDV